MAVAGRRLGVKRFRQRDDDSFSSIYVVNCMVKKERPEIKSRSVVVHSDINRVHSWRIFDTFWKFEQPTLFHVVIPRENIAT